MAKSSTSSVSKKSIDSLAKPSDKKTSTPYTTVLIVFIVSLLIIWFVLYAFRPIFVQEKDEDGEPTGKIHPGKSLGIAFGAALLIALIAYLIIYMKK